MGEDRKQWWYLRSEDLLALGEAQAPLYVYNEETLNEIFFDLSATEVLAGFFTLLKPIFIRKFCARRLSSRRIFGAIRLRMSRL
jgi:hypothetical protein